jgi:DNA polymerase gamma 1
VPRNEVGVQLLSRNLHSQIFREDAAPPPTGTYVQIAQDHLLAHELDTSKAATLPDITIDLPPLQGDSIDEHFHRIGTACAEPTISMAKRLASEEPPPLPDTWVREPGWTKYYTDGSFEAVENLGDEDLITFDVETMPNHSPYAVIACAATPRAWYVWLSPWLLGRDPDPCHLIPIGSPNRDRVIVGHNVSYDRARIAEEYHIVRSGTRFIDTMALHVAVRGISSPQRPTWTKWRKEKREQLAMTNETIASLRRMAQKAAALAKKEADPSRREQLDREIKETTESIMELKESRQSADSVPSWEDVSSLGSLAEVARLYCGIEVNKEPRDHFMKLAPEEILADLENYISYCVQDVRVTHAVFAKVLPLFLKQCPHPVSFAGISLMGNSFLPVNESWDAYVANAEATYRASEAAVLTALHELAVSARDLYHTGEWKQDPWLAQLDWTPKIPKQNRLGPESGLPVVSNPTEVSLPPCLVATIAIPDDNEAFGMRHDGTYGVPAWLHRIAISDSLSPTDERDISIFTDLKFRSCPVRRSPEHGWLYQVFKEHAEYDGGDVIIQGDDAHDGSEKSEDKLVFIWKRLEVPPSEHLFHESILQGIRKSHFRSTILTRKEMIELVALDKSSRAYRDKVLRIASKLTCARRSSKPTFKIDSTRCMEHSKHPVFSQLDWTMLVFDRPPPYIEAPPSTRRSGGSDANKTVWPKWYFDLTAPKAGKPPGTLDLSPRTRASVLLLRLSWRGFPLFYSRQHGWTFRVDGDSMTNLGIRHSPLVFDDLADVALKGGVAEHNYSFFKLPHKDGDEANVGSPLSKAFLSYAIDGTLASPNELAAQALQMNAECSYWISARERIMGQMVVREAPGRLDLGITETGGHKWGIIVPQVVTMGTITRRAMERTWLTASNAKNNRVGSELKAMVRAPPGFAIVGADVDSEELWISSVIGDSQFGVHGASALGWMTLEGTKAQGTDLHSKTAQILGISRDQAKVFNYSRIYGAGKRHGELLLLQSNPSLKPRDARSLANTLYASTKGKKTRRKDAFGKVFWHGGTESFVFNRLEEIAASSNPRTPALGCGITSALTQEYLSDTINSDYMPSRVNWVVQSSGVDYLHLLLVSMEYLMTKYNIKGRYLISVHDEVRYLVREEDQYRLALALQIANLWTRSQFAYRLGFDDLPQSVAFFSAIDLDHVLRKEVDLPCVTPSYPAPIPPGNSIDIYQLLQKLPYPSLASNLPKGDEERLVAGAQEYAPCQRMAHRSQNAEWLQAQATQEYAGVLSLWRRLQTHHAN